MADPKTQAQLDRIEKLAKQAVNKLDNQVARTKKISEALDTLEASVADDATKKQVRKVIDLVKDLDAPEETA